MYEATQRQREIERLITAQKRRIVGLEAAGIDRGDETYRTAASRLNQLRRKYREFSAAAGLRIQPERIQESGFGRSQAAATRNIA